MKIPGLLCFAAIGALASSAVLSQMKEAPQTVADVVAKGAKPLSAEQVRALLPGATMSRLTPRGFTQRWTNEAGGNFVVSTTGLPATSGRANTGKWNIESNGRYCVDIDWRAGPAEKWCQFVLQGPDGYFLTPNPKYNSAPASRFEIGK
jgi:hypothetical protein